MQTSRVKKAPSSCHKEGYNTSTMCRQTCNAKIESTAIKDTHRGRPGRQGGGAGQQVHPPRCFEGNVRKSMTKTKTVRRSFACHLMHGTNSNYQREINEEECNASTDMAAAFAISAKIVECADQGDTRSTKFALHMI